MIYKDTIFKLTNKQREIFHCNERFISVVAGRRGGKTANIKFKSIKQLQKPNADVIVIEPSFKQAKDLIFRPLLNYVKLFDPKVKVNLTDWFFVLSNGSRFSIGSGEAGSSLRGYDYTDCHFDEAAFIQSYIFYDVVYPIIARNEGTCHFWGTPNGKNNWFYDISYEQYVKRFHYTSLEGGLFPAHEIEKAKARLDEKTFRAEFEASFENNSSTAYYSFSDANIVKLKLNPDLPIVFAWDFNAGEMPMACLIIQYDAHRDYVVKEFIHQYSNTEGTALAVAEWLREQGVNERWQPHYTGDHFGKRRSSNASETDYDIIKDIIHKPIFGTKDFDLRTTPTPPHGIKDRVAHLNSRFKSYDGTINQLIDENCKYTVNDCRRVEFLPNGTKLDGSNKWHTHPTDADCYFAINFREKYKLNVRSY